MTTTTPPEIKVVVGIDIGAESTKVVLGAQKWACEIVRSPSGLHATPTAVSYATKIRQVGEAATLQRNANTILYLNRLLFNNATTANNNNNGSCGGDLLKLEDFYSFESSTTSDSGVQVEVDFKGERQTFSAAAVLAVLMRQLQSSVQATIQRMEGQSTTTPAEQIQYVVAVPPNHILDHQALLDAAFAAGWCHVQLVETSVAHAMAYQRKFPDIGKLEENGQEGNDNHGESKGKVVMVVDMGHGQTAVTLVQFGGKASPATDAMEVDSKEDGKEGENKEGNNTNNCPFTILASKTNASLGATSVDLRLWQHFQSTNPKLGHIQPKSRGGQRLLQGAHKLKHLLSQLPEGQVTVENVGENDTDVNLQATRNTLSELCHAEMTALKTLLTEALDEAKITDVSTIHAVEVLGGGCRIPWVQETIQQALTDATTLSKSLDDTSAALGAALVGDALVASPTDDNNKDVLMDGKQVVLAMPGPSEDEAAALERRQQLRQAEEAMAAGDQDEHSKSETFNQIEAKILELRSAKNNNKHGGLLPGQELDDYLNQIDDWLFSEQADNASLGDMETKLQEVLTKTQELCADYYKAIKQDTLQMEQEMELAAKQAKEEAEANGGNGDDDDADHDTRRLPKKRRMEIVMKNKAEANELFKDGNWRFAAARYTKALTHCAKFVDLSPDDIKEVQELKLTLNLNLALAYTKMDNFDQALRVCNEALAIDDASAKAYFRRASVLYEKKKWDEAKKDIVQAKKLAEGDKAIQKLADRIELQLKKQKQKEKKMASKMFG